jgi:uncharacterized protein involved in type VI secretion and phage assembly
VSGPPFWGKFRGTVSDNQDPLMTGRIKAKVPDVLGDVESGWALPALPFTGASTGFVAVPPSGALVWIEFEHGDPDYPVWTGGFWGSMKDLPQKATAPPPPWKKVLIVSEGGNQVVLDDTPGTGGITLETSGGQKITMTQTGVEITNGQGASIKLSPTGVEITNGQGAKVALQAIKVSLNDGALEVM